MLFLGPVFTVFGMEDTSEQKDLLLNNIPGLLGYSQKEVKNNKNKQSEYLKKLQLVASLTIIQEELRKKVGVISDTTNDMQESLKDFFYRFGFVYTDRPCRVQQILCGSHIFFEDGNHESEIVPDTFVLTTADAKAAYLQAKNLLKIESLTASDRMEKILSKSGLASLDRTHNKLGLFIETLLAADNHELVALGKWLQHTRACEKQSKEVLSINTLLKEVALAHDPLFLRNTAGNQAAKTFGEKIEKEIEPILGFVSSYLPAFKGLLGVSKSFIEFQESYTESDELPNFDRYEKLRSIFIKPYTLVNEKLQQSHTLYSVLQKELVSHLQDRTCKNRLELIKNYSRPLYPQSFVDSVFPEKLSSNNVVVNVDVTPDEWVGSAKKFESKRKNTDRSQQQQRNKKVTQKKNQQKKSSNVQSAKKIEKEFDGEKEPQTSKNIIQQNSSPKKLPNVIYDQRVLRWRDSAFLVEQNPDERSLLYHTMPFVVNQLNKLCGVRVKQANRTHPGREDTHYYMGGEIHYKKGERTGQKETVLFALCEDDSGIAYHVGWNPKEDSLFEVFATSEYDYKFPPSNYEPTFEKNTVVVNVNDEKFKAAYRESQFCYEVDDAVNGVTIILFKPSFNA